MSKIWKRQWKLANGTESSAWIVDYFDNDKRRRFKAFKRRRDADAYLTKVRSEVAHGTHTAPSQSITVVEAAKKWLKHVEAEGREVTTLRQYRQHVNLHIVPRIGSVKLANLSSPRIQHLCDDWLADLSRPLARKVLVSLKSMLKYSHLSGLVAQNVAAPVRIKADMRRDKRSKLEAGKDMPTPSEVKAIIDHAAEGRGRTLLMTAALMGLRASELRGLRWSDVNLKEAKITVTQRADRYNTIGHTKSHASERTIPIPLQLVNTLKSWKLQCPPSDQNLVFPTSSGHIQHHKNISERILAPAQVRGGVVDKEGKPKYSFHALRHFYASWCINRKKDGGLELPLKVVQDRLGHASIVLTMDLYGHLFPSKDDGAELAAGVEAIFAT